MLALEGSCMIITFLSIRIPPPPPKALPGAKLRSNIKFRKALQKCH